MIKWDVLVSPFLLPVSFLWDAFCFWRLWINHWLSQPGKEHLTKVSRVQAQVVCLTSATNHAYFTAK